MRIILDVDSVLVSMHTVGSREGNIIELCFERLEERLEPNAGCSLYDGYKVVETDYFMSDCVPSELVDRFTLLCNAMASLLESKGMQATMRYA